MTAAAYEQPSATSAPLPRSVDVLIPMLVVVVCGGLTLRWEVAGRGGTMWVGYPFGLLVSIFFGLLGLWAAAQIVRVDRGPLWFDMLRIAALVAGLGALHTITLDLDTGRYAAAALLTIVFAGWMFRQARFGVVWIALVLFLVLTISSTVLRETLFTLLARGAPD